MAHSSLDCYNSLPAVERPSNLKDKAALDEMRYRVNNAVVKTHNTANLGTKFPTNNRSGKISVLKS